MILIFVLLTFDSPKKAAPKKLAPKRKAAVKEAMITRKHTAALAASTEKILASKIGHLEILKGTRKELEQKAKGGEQKAKMRTSKDRGATKA